MPANVALARTFIMDKANAGPWYLTCNGQLCEERCKICGNQIGKAPDFFRLLYSADPEWTDAVAHRQCLVIVKLGGADFLDLIT